jgi:hypothetical protein
MEILRGEEAKAYLAQQSRHGVARCAFIGRVCCNCKAMESGGSLSSYRDHDLSDGHDSNALQECLHNLQNRQGSEILGRKKSYRNKAWLYHQYPQEGIKNG